MAVVQKCQNNTMEYYLLRSIPTYLPKFKIVINLHRFEELTLFQTDPIAKDCTQDFVR